MLVDVTEGSRKFRAVGVDAVAHKSSHGDASVLDLGVSPPGVHAYREM